MIRFSKGLLGISAVSLAFCAASLEIAFGNSLPALPQASLQAPAQSTITYDVNRTAKSDRSTPLSSTTSAVSHQGVTQSATYVFELPSLVNTSVVMRLTNQARPSASRPAISVKTPEIIAKDLRHPVACEGVVSVLTDVAKRMAPGRCVT